MKTIALRLAHGADIRPIADMSRYLIEVGLRGWSWNPARVAAAIRHRESAVVVAEVQRKFAGFAIGEFGDARLHLSLLAVDPKQQRKGVGRALVAWLEKSALTAGIGEIHLELRTNNRAARAFYDALGFALTRSVPGYYRGEESALRMRKVIATPATGTAEIEAHIYKKLFKINNLR